MKEKNFTRKLHHFIALFLGAFLLFAHGLYAQNDGSEHRGKDIPLTPTQRGFCRSSIIKIPIDSADGHRLGVYVCGLAPFQYEWSTGDTTPFIHVDSTGKYCVTVTDATHCKSISCIDLNPKPHDSCRTNISIRIIPLKRKGQTILWTLVRGKPPFQYQWSTGDTTSFAVVPDTGKYCVTVTDSRGCTAERCIVLPHPGNCSVIIHSRPRTDSGWLLTANGSGVPPFTFRWSTGDSSQRIFVKRPGRYCVTMTDSKGCEARHCIRLPSRKSKRCLVFFRAIPTPDSCFYLRARYAGRPPIRLQWSTGETTPMIRTCQKGKICLTMTDATGCSDTFCLQLPPRRRIDHNIQQDAPATSALTTTSSTTPDLNELFIYPNPTDDQLYIVLPDNAQNPLETSNILYKIYSLNGFCMASGTLRADQPVLSISVNHLPSSMYILQLIIDDQILMHRFSVH